MDVTVAVQVVFAESGSSGGPIAATTVRGERWSTRCDGASCGWLLGLALHHFRYIQRCCGVSLDVVRWASNRWLNRSPTDLAHRLLLTFLGYEAHGAWLQGSD
jgi:hypothetical protein